MRFYISAYLQVVLSSVYMSVTAVWMGVFCSQTFYFKHSQELYTTLFSSINDQRVNLPLLMLSSQLVSPPQILNPAFSSISFSRYNFFHRYDESLLVLTRGLSTLHLRQSKTSLPNLSYHITVPLCGLLLAATRNHIDFTSSLSCPIAFNYS